MIPDSFKEKVLKLCDRWYGKNGPQGWEVWEKPLKRGPGFMDDYKITIIPNDPAIGVPFEERIKNLKHALDIRRDGKQEEEIQGMIKRNEEKKKAEQKDFLRETGAFAREARSTFAKLADEVGSGRIALRQQFPGLTEDEFKRKMIEIEEENEKVKFS